MTEKSPKQYNISMRRQLEAALLLTGAFAAIIAAAPRSSAVQFAPTCVPNGEFPFNWETAVDTERAVWSTTDYANKQDSRLGIMMSQFTRSVAFRLASFNTEQAADFLFTGWQSPSTGVETIQASDSGDLTALMPAWGFEISAPSLDSLQAFPGFVGFASGTTGVASGVRIDRLRVTSCTGNNYLAPPTEMYKRYSGVIQAPNDTIYFKIPASAEGHLTIAARDEPFTGSGGTHDFDLYARCNAYPTPTAWNYRDYRTSSQNFIEIDEASSGCSPPANWYVAINSYDSGTHLGSAQYHFVWSRHRATEHKSLQAGIGDFQTNKLPAIRDALTKAARIVYANTEGAVFIGNITLHVTEVSTPVAEYDGSCGIPVAGVREKCDTVFLEGDRRAYAGRCTFVPAVLFPSASVWGADPLEDVLAHEWGHKHLCLDDEYVDTMAGPPAISAPWCGHSFMGSIRHGYMCKSSSHGSDGTTSPPSSPPASNWDSLVSRIYGIPSRTPDTARLDDFDFNGLVGQIIEVP